MKDAMMTSLQVTLAVLALLSLALIGAMEWRAEKPPRRLQVLLARFAVICAAGCVGIGQVGPLLAS